MRNLTRNRKRKHYDHLQATVNPPPPASRRAVHYNEIHQREFNDFKVENILVDLEEIQNKKIS